ncbi:hypothetical protein ZYGR_0AI02460 [Zygosaccharomyces rouxii]|uniref:Bul1 N-terminal domain-containing protein n=1 Tax=Zygosaccharomyces rouxii TaxID=4956 RepID=A0A1Q3AB31_ZYGRO|nr:hypothetical protein ZYGR_0AI02460 [Zygosaccharomyces rouxii]
MTINEEIDELAHILPSFDFFNRYYLNVPAEENESPLNLPNYEEIDRPILQRPSVATFDSISEADDSLKDSIGNGITNVSMDNLHKLPEVDSPYTIEIHVTPNAPKFGKPLESPNFLKEYTSGDVVHGMVVVSNNSDKLITFEMFYVMLEGTIVVVDRVKKTRSVKNILRTADMGASWAQFHVESSVPTDQSFGKFDHHDKATLGFPHNKLLQPHGRYKKFFSFKIPDQLLESQCPHGMSEHFALPPSMGIDKHRKGCDYRDIKINRQLGYGRAATKGGPMWVDDLANDDACVNYSVKAILVGRNNKTKELVNLRQSEYSIRVIPTFFDLVSGQKRDCSGELELLVRESESSIAKLESVKKRYDEKGYFTSEDLELDVSRSKERQLLPLPRRVGANSEKTPYAIEMELVYKVEPNWASKLIHRPQQKAGILVGRIRTPNVVLPYRPPILIDHQNRFELKTKYEQENLLRLSQFSSSASPDLEIELECKPANNSDGKPPTINAISAELISFTGMSNKAIPIKLSHTALLRKGDEIRTEFQQYAKRLDDLQSWFMSHSANIETPLEQIVPKSLHSDVLAIQELQVKIDRVPLLVTEINSTDWDSELQRRITVNLKQPPFKKRSVAGPIIPPAFESCICFRSYIARLKLRMDDGVGALQLDVPIDVRNVTSRTD